MFKGTNKMWKVVALALALCMLPVAAFASAPSAATVAIDEANSAVNADGSITIVGTTTSSTVTILAVRSTETVEDFSAANAVSLFENVVYAAQKAVNNGTFSFVFVPKADDVVGRELTVFVGGTGVSELDRISFSLTEPTPTVTPVWYKGDDLELNLSGVTGDPAKTWFNASTFTVNDTAIVVGTDCEINDAGDQITFASGVIPAEGPVNISITAEAYASIALTGISPSNKPAGTFSAVPADAIAGVAAEATVAAAEDEIGAAWEAALTATTATVTFGGTAVSSYSYDAATDKLTFVPVIAADAENATGTLMIAGIENYEDAESDAFTVTAPTVKDAAALGTALTPVDTNGGEEEANDAYHVVLSEATTYGSTITWTVKVDDADYVAASAGNYNLVRAAADSAAKSTKYTFKATVEKAGSITKVVDFATIEINKLGVAAFGHVAPSITGVVMTVAEGTLGVVGNTITATIEGAADNMGYTVVPEYVWTIGDETVSTTATYAPTAADIGKELTVTATPTVAEEEPFTGEPKTATVTVIIDPAYVPTVDVAIAGKVTAGGTAAAATATYDLTYEAATEYAVTYTWYVVPAELVKTAPDKIAAAIALVADGAEGVVALDGSTYAKDTTKDYAVVKAEATYTIAGVLHEIAPVDYAAVVISAKSSGTAGGGATLPGAAKPSTPADPENPAEDEVSGDPIANGAAAFTDVDKETYAWAYDSIDALAKAGIFKGMTPTTFGPELETTNAQVIALAVRIAGLKAEGAKTDRVAADHWAYDEVAIAEANGILDVFGEGAIEVEGATTREVAFALLFNALEAAGIELPEVADAIEYTDASSIDAACADAITALTKAGIVNGMGDGTLAPKATITRAQLAKILGLAQALVK